MLLYLIPSKLTIYGLEPFIADAEPYELLACPNLGHFIIGYGEVVKVEWDVRTKDVNVYCVLPKHNLTDRYKAEER